MNIIIACIAGAIISFGISYGLGYVVIPFLHKLKYGQTISGYVGEHQKKQGTPTMGGMLFIISTVVTFIAFVIIDKLMGGDIVGMNEIVSHSMKVKVWSGFVLAIGFSVIGFLDDYIKVAKKRNMGLTIKQKTAIQIVVMAGYLLSLYINDPTGSMFIPFIGMVETKFFFWIIGVAVIFCTTNAVNFTDGIDGLCGSVTLTAALSFAAIGALRNCFGVSLLASVLAGGLVGYLIWNWHPAKVFMGDFGSMFLGGMIVALAYAVDCPIIILLSGIIYVAEFGSDIIQISYFKLTHGKRIFRMAPIHHHFQKGGWNEVKIVKVFTLVNLSGCLAAAALVYFGNLK